MRERLKELEEKYTVINKSLRKFEDGEIDARLNRKKNLNKSQTQSYESSENKADFETP